MKWAKRLLYLLVFLVVVVAVLPFVLPLSVYIPEIEKLASDKLHEPVRVRGLRAMVVPTPQLVLEGIAIGATQDAKIETIRIVPELSTLFEQKKVLKSVELESVSLSRDALGRMPLWAQSDGGPSRVLVKKILLGKVRLDFGKVDLGALDGEVNFGNDGAWRDAVIQTADAKLRIAIKPAQGEYLLDVTAKNWHPPVGPAMLFDRLNIQAAADTDGIRAKEIDGSLYGGSLKGTANLGWKGGWRLNGQLHTKGVELRALVPLFNPSVAVSGKLQADASYAMKAATADQLTLAPSVDAKFNVKDGVLYNMDLMKAVKVIAKEGSQGGQTKFDDFSGTMRLANKAFRFSQIRLSSGLLAAGGNVDISPAKQLAGRVNVQIKGTATMVDVPLIVTGTLQNPVLFPSGAAIAGALAGTGVLGPGVGTALGVKAGELVDQVFR